MPIKREDIQYIRQAKAILTENFDRPITIPQLAKKAGINEAKLKKGFKDLYGQSIHDCLQQLRIDKAKHLLTTTNITVTDISFYVGYSQHNHFITLFKRVVGAPPAEWREQMKRKKG
jgi:AraC-like DNA-binding protein